MLIYHQLTKRFMLARMNRDIVTLISRLDTAATSKAKMLKAATT